MRIYKCFLNKKRIRQKKSPKKLQRYTSRAILTRPTRFFVNHWGTRTRVRTGHPFKSGKCAIRMTDLTENSHVSTPSSITLLRDFTLETPSAMCKSDCSSLNRSYSLCAAKKTQTFTICSSCKFDFTKFNMES